MGVLVNSLLYEVDQIVKKRRNRFRIKVRRGELEGEKMNLYGICFKKLRKDKNLSSCLRVSHYPQ